MGNLAPSIKEVLQDKSPSKKHSWLSWVSTDREVGPYLPAMVLWEEISILLTSDPWDLKQTKDQSGARGEDSHMSNSREAIVRETFGLGTASLTGADCYSQKQAMKRWRHKIWTKWHLSCLASKLLALWDFMLNSMKKIQFALKRMSLSHILIIVYIAICLLLRIE